MKTYTVAVEVRKIYHIEVLADSEDEAMTTAGDSQSTDIQDGGMLVNVEVEPIEIEKGE
jgi:hypothetical protein